MDEFLPNFNPRLATLSAILVGYALTGNLTADEQRAIGNWIITVGQILLTNASFQVLIEDRIVGNNNININSKQAKCGGSPFTKGDRNENYEKMFKDINYTNNMQDIDLEKIKEVVAIMQEEIDNLINNQK